MRALDRSTLLERVEVAGFFVRRGLASAWGLSRGVVGGLAMPAQRTPSRLFIAPQDIRTSDPTIAGDIYSGYWAFAGRVVDAHGRSPFELAPPSDAWAEALHDFGWLRHLRAADTALARANGRALIEDWIGSHGRRTHGRAWRTPIVARRLMAWLSQSPVILEGADGRAYRRLMRSLARHATVLRRRLAGGLVGEDRLWAALALAEYSLCADGAARNQRHGARTLIEELGRQILSDGGHVSRNPAVLVDLLLNLLPLRQAFAARGTEVPLPLLHAIDRMLPMVRMCHHPDGSIALFNGMGVTQADAVATVLAYDDARGTPLANAPYSGYQRLETGGTVLVCDTGAPPPSAYARRAHAGTLSFELSAGRQRLIVNCGAPAAGRDTRSRAPRVTAAHSTLTLGDRSSSRFVRVGWSGAETDDVLVPGPRTVVVNRISTREAEALDLSHDGYARDGYMHRRRLRLGHEPAGLWGEDHLVPTAPAPAAPLAPYAIRFHLHPSVRAAYAPDGQGIVLTTPATGPWLFEAGVMPVTIEESIFFASAEGPRRTEQLVIQANAREASSVFWSLLPLPL